MRKKMLIFHFAYYILSLLLYMVFLYCTAELFPTTSLGGAIALTYSVLFFATPILIVAIMRFSLLRWYVDPFAAAEVPLFLYFGAVIKRMQRSGVPFFDAILTCNEKFSADGGEGWLFFSGLFLFGLAASFSFARKRGESISYRLISKIIT